MKTALIGKLAGAIMALGLAIGAGPASAFPTWGFFGGGGFPSSDDESNDGALGGDNQYAPFDGRYYLRSGGMEFTANDTTLNPPLVGDTSALGVLEITMELDGFAFNASDTTVPDNTYLGIFDFTIVYTNAQLTTTDTDAGLLVELSVDNSNQTGPNPGEGLGTLFYRSDSYPLSDPESDSVDGESQEDTIVFRTPECLDSSSLLCASKFFEWTGIVDETSTAFTPTGADDGGFLSLVDELAAAPGDAISPQFFSLFHAKEPCTVGVPNVSGDFFCNPTAANYAITFPGGGDDEVPAGYFDSAAGQYLTTYEDFVVTVPAGFSVAARIAAVPEPTMVALLGIGMAGLGFTRRRAGTRGSS